MAMRRLGVRTVGFVEGRRWLCSELPSNPSSSSSTKESTKIEGDKEETGAANSLIKKFMLSHPVISPKVTEVHKKVDGSWYVLKDMLTEMKSKILPSSQANKQIADEASSESNVMEGALNGGKLDGPQKGSVSLTGILNVERSQTTRTEDSENISSTFNTDNVELTKPKQMGHSLEMSNVEKSCNTEAKDGDNLLLMNIHDNINLSECKLVEQSMETLDVGTSHAEDHSSEDLSLMKISGNSELVEPVDDLSSSSDLSQSTNHVAEQAKTPRASISNMNSYELKITEDNLSEKEDIHSLSAKENFSSTETATTGKGNYVFDIFNKERDKIKELNETKIDAPKHGMSENGNRHVLNLVEVFKMRHKDSGDKLSNEKQLEQDDTLNMQDRETKDLLNQIIEIAKNAENSASSPTLPSKKISKFNRESDVSMERFVLPSLNKKHKQESQHDKDNFRRGEVQTERNECSDADISKALEYPEPEPSDFLQSVLSSQRADSDATPSHKKCSSENRLLLKFLLKTTKVNDLRHAYDDCGPISEVRILNSRSGNRFNYGYICFKTAEGLKRALSKMEVSICGTDVIVEPASSLKTYNKTFNAQLVTDLDIPIAFVKHPSRMIMVKGLHEDLSFHDLTHALSCWGQVSSIAMSSSPSDAYVEFKTEEAKDRALAEATVSVSGKKLTILRIDPPRTTVVRISNVNPISKLAKIRSICGSHGQVKRLVNRDANICDVYFSSSEWTNMLKILNRLNGRIVDEHQWIAQPATVIPAEVLQALWNKAEGRKHVHVMIQALCKRIEENSIDTSPMLNLAHEYYGDR